MALLTTLTLLTALEALELLITIKTTTCTIYNNYYVLQDLHYLRYVYYNYTGREQYTVCNHQKNYCVYTILIAKAAIYFVSILRELLLFTIRDSNLYVYFTSA